MNTAPPERGDWIMDLVAKKPREVLGAVVHEGVLVKVWYRLSPNHIRALFPGQFRKLKKSEPGAATNGSVPEKQSSGLSIRRPGPKRKA